jgi:acetoin utilization deacetylase AcuC-like enzyme
MSPLALRKLTKASEDLYYSHETFAAALLAAGGCLAAARAVTAPGLARRAMALVRPPSHHATRDAAMGTYEWMNEYHRS